MPLSLEQLLPFELLTADHFTIHHLPAITDEVFADHAIQHLQSSTPSDVTPTRHEFYRRVEEVKPSKTSVLPA